MYVSFPYFMKISFTLIEFDFCTIALSIILQINMNTASRSVVGK